MKTRLVFLGLLASFTSFGQVDVDEIELKSFLQAALAQPYVSNCNLDEWIMLHDHCEYFSTNKEYADCMVSSYNYCGGDRGLQNVWESIGPNKKMKEISAKVEVIDNNVYVVYNYKYSFILSQNQVEWNKRNLPTMKKVMWDELYNGEPYHFGYDLEIGVKYNYWDKDGKLVVSVSFSADDFINGYY